MAAPIPVQVLDLSRQLMESVSRLHAVRAALDEMTSHTREAVVESRQLLLEADRQLRAVDDRRDPVGKRNSR